MSDALRRAKAVPRELLAIINAGIPIDVTKRQKRLRTRLVDLPPIPAAVAPPPPPPPQAPPGPQWSQFQVRQQPPEEYEDQGDFEFQPPEEPRSPWEQLRDNIYDDMVNRRYQQLSKLLHDAKDMFTPGEIGEAVDAVQERLQEEGKMNFYEDYEDFLGIGPRAEERRRQEEEKKRELEREQEENRISTGIQRNRDRWVNLEQYINRMDRNRWLMDAARTKSRFGLGFEGYSSINGMQRLHEMLPAIDFVERGEHLDFPPQRADWRKCGRCIHINEDGVQCDRYASCHRDNPSLQFCWQHAKMAHQENNTLPNYQRRIGLTF